MAIAGIGYGNTAPYYPHINSRTGKGVESQSTLPEARESGNITLEWSDGAVFASGAPDGQSFSIYKSEGYCAEQPMLTIRGIDKDGNSYEKQIDPRMVDPENASYVEMMAVNAYLVDMGELDVDDFAAFERPTEDDLEKADYLQSIREWRDTQYRVGNMVGYHKAAKVCDALLNLQHEQKGIGKVLEGPDGEIRVKQKEGRFQSGIIGLNLFGTGDNFRSLEARYADDSTVENPIIEVRISKESGEVTVFRMNINDIDPENATQLEMFALCSHADAQGISASDSKGAAYKLLMEYASACGYEEDTVVDFVGKRRNWAEIVKEAGNAKGDGTQNIADVWTEMLKELLEAFGKNLSDEATGNGAILGYLTGEERFEIGNGKYRIKQGKDQTFTITDRETGEEHTFSEKQATLEKEKESGRIYLLNRDDDGKITDVMEVSEELLGYLNAFFMTNHLKPGEMEAETEVWVKDILAERSSDSEEADSSTDMDGLPSREQVLTDQKYTDEETGISWYAGKDGIPYMLEEDAEKLIRFCEKTGEDGLEKAGEMTGLAIIDSKKGALSMKNRIIRSVAHGA